MSSLDLEARTSPNILEMGYDKRMMVVSGRASRDLGAKIASKLGVGLTDAGLKTFTDGEVYCRYAESIRGADVFIINSIVGNEPEGVNVNDALMELLAKPRPYGSVSIGRHWGVDCNRARASMPLGCPGAVPVHSCPVPG